MKIPFLNIYITATDYKGRHRAKLDRIGDLGDELLKTETLLDDALKLIKIGDKQRDELNARLLSAQKARMVAVSGGDALACRLACKQESISIAETFLKEVSALGVRLGPKANGTLRRVCREADGTLGLMRALPTHDAKLHDNSLQRVLKGYTRPANMPPVVLCGEQTSGKSEIGELLELYGYKVCDEWDGSTALPEGTHVAITSNVRFGLNWVQSQRVVV
jgi:hypothetical protein